MLRVYLASFYTGFGQAESNGCTCSEIYNRERLRMISREALHPSRQHLCDSHRQWEMHSRPHGWSHLHVQEAIPATRQECASGISECKNANKNDASSTRLQLSQLFLPMLALTLTSTGLHLLQCCDLLSKANCILPHNALAAGSPVSEGSISECKPNSLSSQAC